MAKKNRFYGKYYKFISDDGFTFAFITSHSNEGDMLQVITPSKGYFLDDLESIKIENDKVTFNIHHEDLSIEGTLTLGKPHPLSKKVMGFFSYFPLECVHEIYSMHHTLEGTLAINGKKTSYTLGKARGYIEGDRGKNFPSKYIWYNSVTEDVTVTMAIATIPILGFIRFTGLLCFITYQGKEYYLCTYNGGKVKSKSTSKIELKKGKYRFTLDISFIEGHPLKAPVKGDMVRYIKENINVPTSYTLTHKGQTIVRRQDELSSLEYMY